MRILKLIKDLDSGYLHVPVGTVMSEPQWIKLIGRIGEHIFTDENSSDSEYWIDVTKNKDKNSKLQISLTFDLNNNFDPISNKKGYTDDEDIIKNATWFAGCASQAIIDSYEKDSTRYIEMKKLYLNIMEQIKNQLTDEQFIKTEKRFRILEK